MAFLKYGLYKKREELTGNFRAPIWLLGCSDRNLQGGSVNSEIYISHVAASIGTGKLDKDFLEAGRNRQFEYKEFAGWQQHRSIRNHPDILALGQGRVARQGVVCR